MTGFALKEFQKLGVLAALASTIAFAQTGEPQSTLGHSNDRRPGDYVVWASADDAACKAIEKVVNSLPGQAVAQASQRDSRFLKWTPTTKPAGAGARFLPVSHVHLEQAGQSRYLLRYTGMMSSTENDSIYVVDSLPSSENEIRTLFQSRPANFSAYRDDGIQRLQQAHGADWKQWFLSEQVLVSAMRADPHPYFFAESTFHDPSYSSNILVFHLDGGGAQSDVCMLRRICGCGKPICSKAFSEQEKTKLVPSLTFCSKGRSATAR